MDPIVKAIERKFQELETRLATVEIQTDTKDAIENTIKVSSAVYDKAAAYTNLIVVAGYASFFGLWSLTKPYLSPRWALIAALLMGLSMAVFVFFEIAKMIVATNVSVRASKALLDFEENSTAREVGKRLKEFTASNNHCTLWLARWWPWTLYPTVVLGFLGIATLLASLAFGIANG
jgi:hypothetical protein